jgi:Asp-tRNA(Asn)/Glu-tRNA(Gln) amidotransferase C subunit
LVGRLVAVSESDVLHVASLARLAIEELNAVETRPEMGDVRSETTGTPIRSDIDGVSVPLALAREALAPLMRDGFYLVPRLGTHEDQGERAP